MEGYVRRQLRVYLVDDHDIVRQGLRDLLSGHRDIWLVGDTHSARNAIEAVARLRIDVLVLDLHLQDGSGIEVCRAARTANPSIAGLLLTSSGDDEALTSAILAGAAGYVIKLARTHDIVDAVRRIGAGKELMDARLVDRAARQLHDDVGRADPPLTAYESSLLGLVVDDRLTDAQIAERTGRTPDEVGADVRALVDRVTGALSQPHHSPRSQ
jgi:two-component system, NarL family, response regulator DevR